MVSDPPDDHNVNPVFGKDFPVRRVLDLISKKWLPIVIYCLSSGKRRFGELHTQIPGISTKVLAEVLKQLETDGLARRKVFPEVPPRTEYELTSLGRKLHEPIKLLCEWALNNPQTLKRIERNRSRRE
ncbi:MAG: helix-turn-helix domain-containing protein [Verrucomicrobiota bacterium]